jgi:hypothetical protein
MGIVEGPRRSVGVAEPVIGVEHATVPVVLQVAVKHLAAGFREKTDLAARDTPALAGVGCADNGHLLNLVRTQK